MGRSFTLSFSYNIEIIRPSVVKVSMTYHVPGEIRQNGAGFRLKTFTICDYFLNLYFILPACGFALLLLAWYKQVICLLLPFSAPESETNIVLLTLCVSPTHHYALRGVGSLYACGHSSYTSSSIIANKVLGIIQHIS